MSAQEHPEELIDRSRRGSLAPEEQVILDRHLASCSVCTGQLALEQRFERDVAAQPRDELLYQRAVQGALERMQRSPRIGRRRALPRWSRWAAAAALLVCGVAGAAAIIRSRAPARPQMQAAALPAEPARTRAPVHPVEAPAAEPPPAEAPVAPETQPRHRTPPAPASAHGSARLVETAEALFERGEKLRREGRVGDAVATYRRLQATYPDTAEARLSFVLAGQLLLRQGHPNEALAQFDRHLSLGGQQAEVGEEAVVGRATALEQLHRTSEAVSAWKSLLARYPRSVYGERARARLEQLTEPR